MLHYLHQPHFEAIVKDEVKANHLKEVPTHGIDGKRREKKGEGRRREEGERRRKREEGGGGLRCKSMQRWSRRN